MTNCKNCGAPLHGTKCEYCGTEYSEDGNKAQTITINLDGRQIAETVIKYQRHKLSLIGR